MAVIVNNQHAASRQRRIQVLQFVRGGFVPVRVQPQEGNTPGHTAGNGVLDLALYQVKAVPRQAGQVEVPAHHFQRRICPDIRFPVDTIVGIEEIVGMDPLKIDVLLGRRRHTFVGIV